MNEVYYTYYQSPIGLLKIGGTENYISELTFVDKPEQVLHGEPGVSDAIHQCTDQLIEFFNGKRKSFDVPVFQPGTEFQQKVWAKLLQVPYGKTISYLELSRQVNEEKAIRAVAATNGKNKIMIIIPCHRIIGSDKNLTGYAGGLWRKKWLLQHEFKIMHGVQTLF